MKKDVTKIDSTIAKTPSYHEISYDILSTVWNKLKKFNNMQY
jgi:hypothetical protein